MSPPLYTITLTSTGEGRGGGCAITDDVLLDVTFAIPASMGGPGGATNPQQLFAGDWSSCFHSALKMVVAQRETPVTDSTVFAEVSVNWADEGGLSLTTALCVRIGGTIQEAADELVAAVHAVCLCSNAIRGNVSVMSTSTVA